MFDERLIDDDYLHGNGCACQLGYEPNEKGKCMKCPVCWTDEILIEKREAFTCGTS